MKKIIFFCLFLCLCSLLAQAQVSYTFAPTSGTYSPITGTSYSLSSIDDGVTSVINIGFDFDFYGNGNYYNQVVITSNGSLYLTNNNNNNAYPSVYTALSNTNNVIAAFNRDLKAKSNYSIFVSTTSDVFTIQWSNFEIYGVSTSALNFQVKLYRNGGKIEIIYGSMSIPSGTSTTVQAGIRKDASNLVSVAGTSWTSNTASSSGSTTLPISATLKPAMGRIFQFTPTSQKKYTLSTSDGLGFGNVIQNTSASRTFNIKNIGNTNLVLSSVSASNGFSVSGFTNNTNLYPNAEATYTLVFSPTAATSYSWNVSFSISGATGTPSYLTATGTGISNIVLIPLIFLDKNLLDFPNTLVGNTSAEYYFDIKNTGNTNLTISSISIYTNSSDFEITSGGASSNVTLSPNQTKRVYVKFKPQSAGTRYGKIRIVSNSENTSTISEVDMIGEGIPQERILRVEPSSLSFKEIIYGEPSPTAQRFYIYNDGNVPMTVSASLFNSNFTCNCPSSQTINAGSSHPVDVQFVATSSGYKTASISVYGNATQTMSNQVNLEANAIQPERRISISNENIDFGEVEITTTKNIAFVLTNVGNADINITGMTIANSKFALQNVSFPFTLPKQSERTITVSFVSQEAGYFSTTATIQGNLDSNSSKTINLTATVPSRVISLNNSSLNFGEVEINTSSTRQLLIQNTGTSDLRIDRIESSNSAFVCSWSGTISANNSQLVDVIFRPTAVQSYSTTLTVVSNKTSGTNTTTASGSGVQARLEITGDANFGEIRKLEQSQARTFTIRNSGSTIAQNVSITLPTGFKFDDNTSQRLLGSLSVGGQSTIRIIFVPLEAKPYSDDLKIKGSNTSETSTRLTGTGTEAVVSLPTTLDFGQVRKLETDQIKKMNLTISNTGNAPLIVTNIIFSDPTAFSATFPKFTINKNQPQSVEVRFTPTEAKVYNANYTLQIEKAESTSGNLTGSLRGEGTEAVISLEGNLDFGHNYTDSTIVRNLTIRNTGKAALFIGNVSSSTNDFTVKQNNFEVAANATYQVPIEVSFKPTGIRDRNATLNFSYSKYSQSTSGKNTIDAKGRGVERISIQNKINNEVLYNQPTATFGASLNTNAEPQKITFWYKTIGGDKYSSRNISSSANSIPDQMLPIQDFNNIGIVYYFEVTDWLGKAVRSNPSHTYIKYLSGNLDLGSIIGGTDQSQYKIISIPLEMNDKTTKSFLEKNLGDYNKKEYRFFHFSNNQNIEYPTLSSIDLGRGYWLLSKSSKNLSNSVEGTVTKITDSKPYYEIPLQQGWNQVGNPFLFDIDWQRVQIFNQNNLNLWIFQNGNLIKSNSTLAKFSGAFVFAKQGVTSLKIPVSSRNGGRTENPQFFTPTWALELNLFMKGKAYAQAQIGMDKEASNEGMDEFDEAALPVFFEEYAQIIFPTKNYFYPYLSSDIAQESDSHIWEMQVRGTGEFLEIVWDKNFFETPKKVILYDVVRQVPVDMKTLSSYQFRNEGNNPFRIYYGNYDFVQSNLSPEKTLIGDIYPNPYQDKIYVPFSLPTATEKYQVKIGVYDQQGREVFTEEKNYSSGYHTWQFEPTQMGNYLLKVTIKNGSLKTEKTLKILKER